MRHSKAGCRRVMNELGLEEHPNRSATAPADPAKFRIVLRAPPVVGCSGAFERTCTSACGALVPCASHAAATCSRSNVPRAFELRIHATGTLSPEPTRSVDAQNYCATILFV
jgi:hypothetical protein